MRVLITGISGFVGRHLLDHLISDFAAKDPAGSPDNADKSLEVTGLDISVDGLQFDDKKNKRTAIDLIECDLRDSRKIEMIIGSFKPDSIYHLAAQSSVSLSWEKPVETFEINVFGSINIYEAVLKKCPLCKILVTCTAEEYGPIKEMGNELPIDESHCIYPSNPYSISKATLDFFSSTYYSAKSLLIYIARSFNHTGPGQSASFVASDFAKQIAEIERGDRKPVISVGNTDVYRDFLDVRDVVRAYKTIIDRGLPGEAYNVCSGSRIKISGLLDILLSLSSEKNIKVVVDKNKLRPVDLKIVYGANKKIKTITGWEPAIDIRTSLTDILNWWRKEKEAD